MADYDHSHIVSAGYLRGWAVDRHLAMRLVSNPGRQIPVSPLDAGVRRGATREQLPDGTFINRLDPAFADLESLSLPLLCNVDELWPLTVKQRGLVSELLSIQVLRSPAWSSFYKRAVPLQRERVRPSHPDAEDRHFAAAEHVMLTDNQRHGRLLWQSPVLVTIMANMHWTLLRCSQPRLVTSDHPVVPICSDRGTETPEPIPAAGLFSAIEFRFAVRPDLLLIMSWQDGDETGAVDRLATHHVKNHNSLVIAQAEKQWFHHPEMQPRYSHGRWYPISTELYSGYGEHAAASSQRRGIVESLITPVLGSDKLMEQVPVVGPWPWQQAA